MQLYLFTHSFPYGYNETFLELEIEILSKVKSLEIIIVPRVVSKEVREIPENIHVDTSYAKRLARNSEYKIYPLIGKIDRIMAGIIRHQDHRWSAVRDVASYVHYGLEIKNWAIKKPIDSNAILYTYWCDVETYGLSLFKVHSGNLLISRLHRFDVYEHFRKHDFIPFRNEVVECVDHLFPVSEDAKKYLLNKYDNTSVETAFLGVASHEKPFKSNEKPFIQIVSCSSLAKVKRLDLIISAIQYLASSNPDRSFKWTHIGGSTQKLNEMIGDKTPENLSVEMKGQLPNSLIHDFYANNYVDLFLNLSESEGIPVSIMEAISYGIPVVATDVGGIHEIVDETNGVLLSAKPSLEEVAIAMISVLDQSDLRTSARKIFEDKFDGQKNYTMFAERLIQIGNNKS